MKRYNVTIYLAFLAAGLPAGIYSIIWDGISENLMAAVPYVGLVRSLIAAGGILACTLCGKWAKRRERWLDLSLAGVSLEAMAVIGLSLSRLFWHLLFWSLLLGLGLGTSLTFLYLLALGRGKETLPVLLSGTPAGCLIGTLLLDWGMEGAGSWRAACQVLGLTEILVGALAFLLRKTYLRRKEVRRKLEEEERKRQRDRDRSGRELLTDQADLERAGRQYLTKAACCCGAALLMGVLVACLVTWPQTYRVAETGANRQITDLSLVLVTLGLALGRVLAKCFPLTRRRMQVLSLAALGILLLLEQVLISRDGLTNQGILTFQLLAGVGIGPILPSLLSLDDVRLDPEDERGVLSLLPAFELGAYLLVTPLAQALVGGGQERFFPGWLLLITAACGCFLLASSKGDQNLED